MMGILKKYRAMRHDFKRLYNLTGNFKFTKEIEQDGIRHHSREI